MKSSRRSISAFLIATSALIAPSAFSQEVATQQQEPTPSAVDPTGAEQTTSVEQQGQGEQAADVIVVRGDFIPEPLQETSEVAAFLTDLDLARQGDSDAASALGRVTGLSVVEGRFVYVRGLGERYSSALLNGSPLPSPEPLQRVVPLDLFPASVLSGVMVQKSYSVEFPGEFGGGVVNLSTKSIPDENFLQVGAGFSANSETSLAKGYTYDGSETDWLGFDDGLRKTPNQLREALVAGRRVDASLDLFNTANPPVLTNAQERQRIGQGFENAKLRLVQVNDSIPINGSFDINGGRIWDFGDTRLGVIGVAGYSNDWTTRDGVRQVATVAGNRAVAGDDFNFTSTTNSVGWDGLLTAGVAFGEHSINLTNLYVRRTTKQAQEQFGFNLGNGNFLLNERTGWYERQLWSSQLAGDFDFGDLDIAWRGAYAQTSRDAPYEWSIDYVFDPTLQRYLSGNNSTVNETRFSQLDDETSSAGIDLVYTLPMSGVRDWTISAGAAHQDNSRESETRSYNFLPNALSQGQQQQRVDFLLSDFNLGPNVGQFQISESTGNIENAPAYTAQLEVLSAYLKADIEPLLYLRTAFGARWEKAIESVQLIDLYGPEPLPNKVKKDYILPAATVTWNFLEDMQIRIGASRTIGRPQFRELAPQSYYDPESGRFLRGNPFLLDTKFRNIDARYEYFFAPEQYITVGAFFKDIDRPVDNLAQASGGAYTETTFNAPAAEILGAEFEVKKIFADPFPAMAWLAGKDLLVQANYTYSDAQVNVGSGDQVLVRTGTIAESRPASEFLIDGSRLQGQSDHVANLQLGWEDPVAGSQGTLIGTYVSERVTSRAVSSGGTVVPDFVEEPGLILDFVYRREFDASGLPVTLSFKAQNLLDEDYAETQTFASSGTFLGGEVTLNGYDRGRTFSVGVSTAF
ncbi:MAG: TonB-dependent receptor plug domain-containing protein [Alphaproteobacteria bacterium]|nr:TonB-dependent receptor plug domain-containing protein [Alphaproteobacteria bacterium]